MHRNKRFAWTWAAAGLFAVAGLIGACDPEDETPAPSPQSDAGTKTDAGSDAGGTTDAGGNTDAGSDAGNNTDAGSDAGTQTDAGTPDAGPQTGLPLAVDGTWAASGYMGAGGQPNGLVDEPICATPRPGAGLGNCHKFTATQKGDFAWAGVFWQFPEGAWADDPRPGFLVPDGAKSVTFYAWSEAGGETVDFFVGYETKDGFTKKITATLTNQPKQYTLDISRVRYTEVGAGFGWSAGGLDVKPLVLFIDDIQWH
ncbi:hypothetical protein [Corallococcus sp. Z5C101001]|uniref:hypothetical protein n=1 Tax=Corallococcus sp. Z5C101001 TaxID=2596829 RepID=UPI0011813B36|nr:hypothetical protein [Corallococcus sp. Z5C101001]TSC26784.1 hypothetical protein FOF48_22230 [Corallococcus sp. Z5C101001]